MFRYPLIAAYLVLSFNITWSFLSHNSLTSFRATMTSKLVRMSAKGDINPPLRHNITLLSPMIVMSAIVQPGYGRGSKKLGFPTCNLPQFDDMIEKLSLNRGVYFGWSYLPDPPQGQIYGMVSNIGKSPTFVGQVSLLLSYYGITCTYSSVGVTGKSSQYR
jgi:FAD synthase